jgi:hypothetical protein
MRKTGLINRISSQDVVSSTKDMQVLDQQSKAYFNFINSLKSESTRKSYTFCIEKFLDHHEKDLDQFLRLSQEEITNLIIKYFVDNKISNQYKNLMSATLKHSCEINDVVLNWKKIKKFINSDKTGNETNGRDRGYTDKEIRTILEFSDQRIRTAFLILASTGMRIGALPSLQINDLEKIDNLYKVTVYRGDKDRVFSGVLKIEDKENSEGNFTSYINYKISAVFHLVNTKENKQTGEQLDTYKGNLGFDTEDAIFTPQYQYASIATHDHATGKFELNGNITN